MTFGKRIKQLRESRGMKQVDVAKALNLPRSNVSRWEKDTKGVSVNTVIAAAKLFGVTTDYLLGLEDSK